MNLNRTLSIMRKEWWHIVRDRRTALLVTLSPVFFLVVLAYSFSVEIKDVSLAVMDYDHTPLSRSYLQMLTASGDLKTCCQAANYDEIEGWLTDGRVKAALIIPPNFAQRAYAGETAQVQVIVDGTDPNTANHAIRHIVSRSANFSTRLLSAELARLGTPLPADTSPVDVRLRTWYNPSLKTVIGIVPALVGVVLGMPAISAWFGVPFRGNFLLYLLLSADFLLATLSIGVLISILVNSQQAAMIISLLVFLFPGFFLSGIFIPLSAMGIMKMEAYMVPTTHYVLINRGIFLKGAGLETLWPWALALLVIGLLVILLSFLIFKKLID
ncbi:MAG: ABC transporter permease [Anaerolineales bacterium]